MKNEQYLDALFTEARNTPVGYSFEETKTTFLTLTVGSTPVSKKVPNVSLKNWIIMITSISILVAITLIFTNQPEQTQKKEPEKLQKQERVDYEQSEVTKTKANPIGSKSNKQHVATKNDSFSITLKPKRALLMNLLGSSVLNRTGLVLPKSPNKLSTSSEEYFPKLTHEEIAANYKQKKKMLKALAKYDKKTYAYIPAGRFDYNGTTISCQAYFMQTTEVSNLEYRTFLFDLLIQGRKEEFKIARPDQHLWVSLLDENQKIMEEIYFSHDAYNNYPVVNISRQGAEMYCKWLNEELQKYLSPSERNLHNDVRLPTRAEWAKAASAEGKQLPYSWDSDSTKNASSCYLGNYMPKPGRYFDDGGFHTVNVNSYNPNAHGLYNMSGNAAEMVYNEFNSKSDIGTAGGGWMSPENEIMIYGPDPYHGLKEGRPDIGFRVVITYFSNHVQQANSGISNFSDSDRSNLFMVTNQTTESDFEEFAKFAQSQGWDFKWKSKYFASKLRFLELTLSDKKGKRVCDEVYFKTTYFGQTNLSLTWSKNVTGSTVFDIITEK